MKAGDVSSSGDLGFRWLSSAVFSLSTERNGRAHVFAHTESSSILEVNQSNNHKLENRRINSYFTVLIQHCVMCVIRAHSLSSPPQSPISALKILRLLETFSLGLCLVGNIWSMFEIDLLYHAVWREREARIPFQSRSVFKYNLFT